MPRIRSPLRLPGRWGSTRLRITYKIALGLAGILVAGLATMLVIYRGLQASKRALHEVTDVKELASAAVYEMEISVIGTGMGVLNYLDTGDPNARKRVKKDRADFQRFNTQYNRLAETPRGKELGRQIDLLYQRFSAVGEDLISLKDQEAGVLAKVASDLHALEQLSQDQVPGSLAAGPEGPGKQLRASRLAAHAFLLAIWHGAYVEIGDEKLMTRAHQRSRSFGREAEDFRRLAGGSGERRWADDLERQAARTSETIGEWHAVRSRIQSGIHQFVLLRNQMSDLLDDEIQVITLKDLKRSEEDADRSSVQALQSLTLLIPVFILVTFGAGLLLAYSITGPVQRLVEGAEAVGSGNFAYRLDDTAGDEFAGLARRFNRMIERLERTMVTKAALETSEQELRKVNAEMFWEITQREIAENRITASLREKEVLLKEVHHRVKNNLEILSSMLELQTARLRQPVLIQLFKGAQHRIRSIAMVHEQMYKSGDLGKVNFREYLDKLVFYVVQSYAADPDAIELKMDIPEIQLDLDTAIPCCLIVQELVSNAFKHAFPDGRRGELAIRLTQDSGQYLLTVRDNGAGLPEGLDIRKSKSLGLQLVDILARQLDGSVEARNGCGTEWRVRFSEARYAKEEIDVG